MAYIRRKGDDYNYFYQLVESRRIDGQPRQKVLLHLGRYATVEEALKQWPREIKKLRRDAERYGGDPSLATKEHLRKAASREREAGLLEDKLARLKTLRAKRSA